MTATPPGAAVTVSITRRADAGREPEMSAWVRTGLSLAERFPGFLGGGWVRGARDAAAPLLPSGAVGAGPATGGEERGDEHGDEDHAGPGRAEWHMLYRFSDPETLAGWEQSGQREWWLGSGRGLVEHTRIERRTGIEGWFDTPAHATVEDLTRPPSPPPAAPPPRWKQAVTIWLGFFPLSLLGNLVLRATIPTAPLVVRIAVLTVAQTPVMTYLLLPWLTRRMSGWLNRGAPDRA